MKSGKTCGKPGLWGSLVEAMELVWDLPCGRGLPQGLQKGPWT